MFGYDNQVIIGKKIEFLMSKKQLSKQKNIKNNFVFSSNKNIIDQSLHVEGKRKNGQNKNVDKPPKTKQLNRIKKKLARQSKSTSAILK